MKLRIFLKKIYHKIKVYIEFMRESQYFCKYYTYASNQQSNLEYKMLILAHSIEKGLCVRENIRPFGSQKVLEIIDALNIYYAKGYDKTFALNLTLSILDEYKKIYEKNNFIHEKVYSAVVDILNKWQGYEKIDCGVMEYTFKNPNCNYKEMLSSRHSVRSFSSDPVSKEEIDYAIDCAIKSPSACNRQMIKAYCFFRQDKNKIDLINRYAQGLSGFDTKNINYFVITYDESAFFFPGEKNQGMFNAGLFCTNLINALHNKGIGSCFIQYANLLKEESEMKKEIGIPANERIAVLIAFGKYNDNYFVPKSTRKNAKDILQVIEDEQTI